MLSKFCDLRAHEPIEYTFIIYVRVLFLKQGLYIVQMFEAEEDGAITEMELAVILKTALGVTHLSVSHLFTAIDAEDTGKITFGKRTQYTIHNPWCDLNISYIEYFIQPC